MGCPASNIPMGLQAPTKPFVIDSPTKMKEGLCFVSIAS